MTSERRSYDAIMSDIDATAGSGEFKTRIDESWLQGRSAFGGLVAAAMLRAARRLVPPERRARSMQIAFVGPIPVGDLSIRARLLRSGRSISSIEARALRGDEVCTTATILFGRASASTLDLADDPPPGMQPLDQAMALPYLPGLTPVFTQHFAYRFGLGGFPFSGSAERGMGGYCRFVDPPARFDEEALLAFVDAWPPPILPILDAPCPVSTVTWMVDFLGIYSEVPEVSGTDWWMYHSEAHSAAEGFARETSRLWTPDGRLAARGVQTTAVFEPRP